MNNNRGMALFIVLGIFFIIILLGNVALGLIANQSRLTHHKVSRIQAQYAAQAGVNLANEQLRTGAWNLPNPNQTLTHYLCKSAGGGCDVVDPSLPAVLSGGRVEIRISGNTAAGCNPPAGCRACITATADYTYTNP